VFAVGVRLVGERNDQLLDLFRGVHLHVVYIGAIPA
jgi:hypothetical protein